MGYSNRLGGRYERMQQKKKNICQSKKAHINQDPVRVRENENRSPMITCKWTVR